ncbi:MAG: ABC transporter permease [Actinomycetes bacterium]
MATKDLTRRGSLQIVDVAKIIRNGSLYVAQARIRSMWQWKFSIIGEAFATPMFYLLSIGIGIGKIVNSHQNVGVDGVKYLTFLAPALLAATCIQGAVGEATHPVLEGFKWQKGFFAMNATPITGKQIANGVLLAAMARTAFGCVIYFSALYAFGAVHGLHAIWLIPETLLAATSFAVLMMGVCAAIKNDDLFLNMVQRFLIMPLFLFSGTFYPLSSMPKFLQVIGWASPLWHSTELGRWISYGHHISHGALAFHFIYFVVLAVIGFRVAHHHFTRRLAK